jgi:tRNA (guanine37-N1)-methyltransferase
MSMQLGIVSLFPDMFAALNYGITGRAITQGHLDLSYWNPRDYVLASSSHRSVDDRPYGGGPGMVMTIQPLRAAIKAARNFLGSQTQVLHLSPQGELLTQAGLATMASERQLILVASRYEGVDERLIRLEVDAEWSIGDYVLTGGELPAMVMIDALIRLQPGVLGHESSALEDSFMNGLLDCPHYTRPEDYEGLQVPKVLLQGNHQAIATWRLREALGRTWLRRPDLLQNRVLTQVEEQLLNDFIREYQETRGNTHE